MSNHEPRKRWDFFISYASEDRATAAEPLAAALRGRGFAVWLDQDALTGDASKLTNEIQAGLTNCHAGIVILSSRFIRKQWPIRELETLLSLETVDGRLRIAPVLHDVAASDLQGGIWDGLRARLTITTASGFDGVCDDILQMLMTSAHREDHANLGQLGSLELPAFRAIGIVQCANPDCTWRVPDDWPPDFANVGPEFTLQRIGTQWCIVCEACKHPVGSLTLDEAREIVAIIQAGGLWGRTPGVPR